MGFRGDLRSVSLGDVLQNLAARSHTGVLDIRGVGTTWLVALRGGAVVAVATDPSADYGPRLVARGLLSENKLAEARRKTRWGKPLARVLLDRRLVSAEKLKGFFQELAYESFDELLALREGEIRLDERPAAKDKEWAAVDLALPVQALLLEAARRSDLWALVRRHIAGPGTVLLFDPHAKPASEIGRAILTATAPGRSLGQIAEGLPWGRLETFAEAAELVRAGLARPAGADALVELAQKSEDPDTVVATLLEAHRGEPANAQVLVNLVGALEREGRDREAAHFLKVLGNVHLEAGREAEALPCLRRAWELEPHDPAPGERAVGLLLKAGALAEAEATAAGLVKRFRELGMLDSWRALAAQLLDRAGPQPHLLAGLAAAERSCGNVRKAAKLLAQAGEAYVSADNLVAAGECYRQVASLMPKSRKVKEILATIRSGTIVEKRRRRRRLAAVLLGSALAVGSILFLGYEAHARSRLLTITCETFERGIATDAELEAAIRRLSRFAEECRGSLAAMVDAPRLLEKLKQRQVEACIEPPARSESAE